MKYDKANKDEDISPNSSWNYDNDVSWIFTEYLSRLENICREN